MRVWSRLRETYIDLKRRRVYGPAIAYATYAWVVAQFGNDILARVGVSDHVVSIIVVLSIAGFPIAVASAWTFQLGSEGSDEPAAPRTSVLAGSLVLTMSTAAALFIAIGLWPERVRPAPQIPDSALDPASIAVLYPLDVTGGEDMVAFGDALTRRLTDALREVSGLRVVSPAAVRPFRDGATPPHVIARELAVGTLVSLSVDRVGDSILVVVRMVEGSSGDLMSSHSVSESVADRIALFDEVANSLTALLRIDLGRAVRINRSLVETDDTTAWTLFTRAISRLEDFESLVERQDIMAAVRALDAADSLLNQASLQDPGWIEPLATRGVVADRQALIALASDRARVGEWLRRGLSYAEAALLIDETDGRARYARGLMRLRMVQYGEVPAGSTSADLLDWSEADLREASDTHPSRAQVLESLSQVMELKGERVEALVHAERAWELDAYLDVADQLANRLFTLSFQLDQDLAAVQWCREGRVRFPGRWEFLDCRLNLMAWTDAIAPDLQRAAAVADSALALYPAAFRAQVEPRFIALRAAIQARAGQLQEARDLLSTLDVESLAGLRPTLAAAWFRAGRPDTSVALIRGFATDAPAMVPLLFADRMLREVMAEPELAQLGAPGR